MNETSKGNIFKIIDGKNTFKGTGFLLTKKYIVTCHHCIYDIDKIYAETGSEKYPARWDRELSCMDKDIALLRVGGIRANKVESRKEIFGGVEVYIWGYSGEKLNTIRYGEPVPGKLEDKPQNIYFKEEKYEGMKKWNKKPAVSVDVYRIDGEFDHGHSGSPVFYPNNNKVGGMFVAKDEKFDYGYVLPIETIFERIFRYYDVTSTKPHKTTVPKELLLFVSKPSSLNSNQQRIWDKLQEVLKNIGISTKILKPEVYRRTRLPIAKVRKALEKCHGVIVLGFKQTHVIKGVSKAGTGNTKALTNRFLATPWNDIEGGMAFMLNLPVLIINEGVQGGIFDTKATDFIVNEVKISSGDWWRSTEFMENLNQWLRDVLRNYKKGLKSKRLPRP